MPSFIALGCLEVGGVISIPTLKLHRPEVGLGWAVTITSLTTPPQASQHSSLVLFKYV